MVLYNYFKRIVFSNSNRYYLMKKNNDLQLLATKRTEKTPNPLNAKEHNQSFVGKKNTKLVQQSKIVTRQPNLEKKRFAVACY